MIFEKLFLYEMAFLFFAFKERSDAEVYAEPAEARKGKQDSKEPGIRTMRSWRYQIMRPESSRH